MWVGAGAASRSTVGASIVKQASRRGRSVSDLAVRMRCPVRRPTVRGAGATSRPTPASRASATTLAATGSTVSTLTK